MYAIYFKQPTKDFCKFRVTLDDWTKMKSFYDVISLEQKYLQARTIFWRLWQSHAFRFVECEMEHHPETMQLNRLGIDGLGEFYKINSTIFGSINALKDENNGLLSAIGTLQLGYNEMKDHFAANVLECTRLQNIDVIDDISSQLKTISKLFENKFENRTIKKGLRKDSSSLAGTSMSIRESETDYDIEMNASYSSYSESNDEDEESMTEKSDGGDNDRCLNIGSKRYYLKRRALQKETGELHRFKTSVVEVYNSPKKIQDVNRKRKATDNNQQSNLTPEKRQISIDNTSGNIVINHQKKQYNRHLLSSVRKQFSECPR